MEGSSRSLGWRIRSGCFVVLVVVFVSVVFGWSGVEHFCLKAFSFARLHLWLKVFTVVLGLLFVYTLGNFWNHHLLQRLAWNTRCKKKTKHTHSVVPQLPRALAASLPSLHLSGSYVYFIYKSMSFSYS